MNGHRPRRRGSTFLEVAATLTIIGLFVGLIVYSSQPFNTVAADTQAKARLQQALALVDTTRSASGGNLTTVNADDLSQRSDGFTFVTSTVAATSTTVSVATATSATEEKTGLATLTPEGVCWYATVDFKASLIANAPLVVAVRPSGGTSACTGAVALTQLPVGTTGRSWDTPVSVT